VTSAGDSVVNGPEGDDSVRGWGPLGVRVDDVFGDGGSKLVVKLDSDSETSSTGWASMGHLVDSDLVVRVFLGSHGESHIKSQWTKFGLGVQSADSGVDGTTLLSEVESPGGVKSGGTVDTSRSEEVVSDVGGEGSWIGSVVVHPVGEVLQGNPVGVGTGDSAQ
jgi:hypothetical protein